MKLIIDKKLKRLEITKKAAIHLARELLELAEGNGVNAVGKESTHWELFGWINEHGKMERDSQEFCFAIR